MTFEEMKADFNQSDEEFARYLFDLLTLQEAKLQRLQDQLAKPAQFDRRENR